MSPEQGQEEVVIIKDEPVAKLLDDRHILDQDVKQVISHAEATGEKLYQPGGDRYLAKLQTDNATFYVEYSPSGDGYQVHTAYFHRSQLMEG
jgi:hypothetical protein